MVNCPHEPPHRPLRLRTVPGLGIVDLMLDVPDDDKPASYQFLAPLLRDKQSQEEFDFPVEYMFKDVPEEPEGVDLLAMVLDQMDHWGIAKACIGCSRRRRQGTAPDPRGR